MQRYVEQFLDARTGPVRVLSSCAGDGRDLLDVLARRSDAERVTPTLLEIPCRLLPPDSMALLLTTTPRQVMIGICDQPGPVLLM